MANHIATCPRVCLQLRSKYILATLARYLDVSDQRSSRHLHTQIGELLIMNVGVSKPPFPQTGGELSKSFQEALLDTVADTSAGRQCCSLAANRVLTFLLQRFGDAKTGLLWTASSAQKCRRRKGNEIQKLGFRYQRRERIGRRQALDSLELRTRN